MDCTILCSLLLCKSSLMITNMHVLSLYNHLKSVCYFIHVQPYRISLSVILHQIHAEQSRTSCFQTYSSSSHSLTCLLTVVTYSLKLKYDIDTKESTFVESLYKNNLYHNAFFTLLTDSSSIFKYNLTVNSNK